MSAVDLVEQGHAVHAIHAQIRNQEIRPEAGQAIQGQPAAFDRQDLEAGRFQTQGQQAQEAQVVVDEQDSGR